MVYEDDAFFEGPAWNPATGKLYFTAFKKDTQQILRLDAPGKATVWLRDTKGINGMRMSRSGRLLGAQAYGHNLLSMKIGAEGPEDMRSLTSNFEGQTYNQPNDLAEAPGGGIYYTDPDFQGKTRSAVYFIDSAQKVHRVITHLKIPNGVLVSNDGKTLYVGDSFEKRIYSYPILGWSRRPGSREGVLRSADRKSKRPRWNDLGRKRKPLLHHARWSVGYMLQTESRLA